MKIVIGAVIALVVGAIAATIWVAAGAYERTVVADPYESGIHHDADRRRAQALGWSVAVDEAALRAGPEARLAATLTGRDGRPLEGAEVTFRVSRAGTSRLDRSAKAHPVGGGRYSAVLPMPEAGFWDLDVVVRHSGETLTLGRWIHVAGEVGEGVHCDAGRRPCAADASGVRVILELAPHPPMPLRDLDATVRLYRGAAPIPDAEVSVDLSMPGMFMGDNRIALRPASDGSYSGRGAIVRCSSGRRSWVAEVVARLPGGSEVRATFPFQAAE